MSSDRTGAPPASSSAGPRKRRGLFIAGGIVLVLVVAIAACEVAGWPFLIGPAQDALSKVLQREFRLQQPTEAGTPAAPHATVRFFGHLRVFAPKIHIAAPTWSQQPFFVEAENARLTLAYTALWRAYRGGPLDIRRLEADTLVAHAERRADGTASWQFGDPSKQKEKATSTPMPTIRELVLRDGTVTYVDVPLRADVTAKVKTREGVDAARVDADGQSTGLQASAKGKYAGLPLTASLNAPGAQALLASDATAPPLPIVFNLDAGKASLSFKGTVTDVTQLTNLTGVFEAKGASLAAVGDPLGVTLPTTGAFKLTGRIAKRGNVWNVLADDAVVGNSKLNAALTFDADRSPPLLSGRVNGPRFFLVDLLPSVGAKPVPPSEVTVSSTAKPKPSKGDDAEKKAPTKSPDARVLPETEFDLPSLRAMNANVLLGFDRVELGDAFNVPLEPLRAHLTLQDGRLLISDLDARTAEGNLAGSLGLDGTGDIALWRARLRWSGVRLERWIKQQRSGDAPPYLSGRLMGRAELKGKGRSTAQILGSLDGEVMTSLQDGKISHLVLEGSGIDLAQAVGVFVKGDDALPVTCAVVDLNAQNGIFKPRAFVIDTKDSLIVVDGNLSLQSEQLDLRAVVTPKDMTPLALRTPILLKGTFGSPSVSVEKAPLARKAGAALLLGLINPLAALIPLIDLGDSNAKAPVGCGELLARARQSASSAAYK